MSLVRLTIRSRRFGDLIRLIIRLPGLFMSLARLSIRVGNLWGLVVSSDLLLGCLGSLGWHGSQIFALVWGNARGNYWTTKGIKIQTVVSIGLEFHIRLVCWKSDLFIALEIVIRLTVFSNVLINIPYIYIYIASYMNPLYIVSYINPNVSYINPYISNKIYQNITISAENRLKWIIIKSLIKSLITRPPADPQANPPGRRRLPG